MSEDEIRQLLSSNVTILHIKGGEYKLLGVGKGKLECGSWFEGAAYLGNDGVYYVRPYCMFRDFTLKK